MKRPGVPDNPETKKGPKSTSQNRSSSVIPLSNARLDVSPESPQRDPVTGRFYPSHPIHFSYTGDKLYGRLRTAFSSTRRSWQNEDYEIQMAEAVPLSILPR